MFCIFSIRPHACRLFLLFATYRINSNGMSKGMRRNEGGRFQWRLKPIEHVPLNLPIAVSRNTKYNKVSANFPYQGN